MNSTREVVMKKLEEQAKIVNSLLKQLDIARMKVELLNQIVQQSSLGEHTAPNEV